MEFFKKIIRPAEVEQLFCLNSGEESIPIGELVEVEPEVFMRFMDVWCQRLDKIVALDMELNGQKTFITEEVMKWRGFTYDEYSALFNQHIMPEQFPFYPVFNQLNRNKGGINTEKQRADVVFHYGLNEDDYYKILQVHGFGKVLNRYIREILRPTATIPISKLFMHLYCVAPTGEGKSVLLESLLFGLQNKFPQYSMVVIDPHGSLAENAKRFYMNSDHERVIYIDPYLEPGFTPTFNPFAIADKSLKNINFTAEQIILAMEEILDKEGGELSENMVNLMEKCVYFLLRRDGSTMLDLLNLLNCDAELFKEAQKFDTIFDDYYLKPGSKTRDALLSRTSRVVDNSPVMRNLLGGKETFDLEAALNNGKVIIFNLSGLGDMSQVAFGKFLVASIKSIVRKRKKNGHFHTFCIIDEAQNFCTGSLEFMLVQLRGFGLHLILANQYTEQFEKQTKAVIKNTAVKIAGGGDDNIDSIQEVIKLPTGATLSDYEFFLKPRNRGVMKFKSPSFLLDNPGEYYLNKEEEKALDAYQVAHYYKPMEEWKGNGQSSESQNSPSTENPKKPKDGKPPFGLFIDEP